MSHKIVSLFILGLLGSLSACTPQDCEPQSFRPCPCLNGQQSTETCTQNGLWGGCGCWTERAPFNQGSDALPVLDPDSGVNVAPEPDLVGDPMENEDMGVNGEMGDPEMVESDAGVDFGSESDIAMGPPGTFQLGPDATSFHHNDAGRDSVVAGFKKQD